MPCRRARRRRSNKKELRLLEATCPNQVWSYDFVHDSCANGQKLKLLTVTDEFTRESLSVEVETRLRGKGVVKVLERLFAERGAPQAVRSDNGPEFVTKAVKSWLGGQQVQTVYIAPGSPWQNDMPPELRSNRMLRPPERFFDNADSLYDYDRKQGG